MSKKVSIEETATRFVNLKDGAAAERFLTDYAKWIVMGDAPSKRIAEDGVRILSSQEAVSGKIFTPAEAAEVRPVRKWVSSKRFTVERITQWSAQLRGAWSRDSKAVDRAENALAQILDSRRVPALRPFKLGSAQPVPRDLVDEIALAILKASERSLLRTCRGHQQGWACPTPYLVADEKRRVYCFMRCGDEAKSRAKAAWWRENKSAAAKRSKR